MKFIDWLGRMGVAFTRVIVACFALVILLAVIGGVTMLFYHPPAPPTIDQATWAIQTYSNDKYHVPSRMYYAKELTYNGATPTIRGYWRYNGKEFTYIDKSLSFPIKDYGIVTVVRRNASENPPLGVIR